MFLSVIIPCYRETEAQLNRCLDSLLFLNDICQWEAWIVDDGSEANLVGDWVASRQDTHLHVVRQANQGPSAARNNGIDRAQGEYMAFVDADDEVIGEAYASLVQLVMQRRPDVLGLRYKPTSTPYFEGDGVDFMRKYDIVPTVWSYIVRRDVIGSLRFTPGIYHEDEEFPVLLLCKAHNVIITPTVAYRYSETQGSITRSRNEVHIRKRFDDFVGVMERLHRYAESSRQEGAMHRAEALTRRVHILAMCLVVNLIWDGYSSDVIRLYLQHLASMGLYPLPSYAGIRRYRWIRIFTRYPWMVVAIHKIFKRS